MTDLIQSSIWNTMTVHALKQGKAVQQVKMDIYKLFGPLFSGIADDVLGFKARIESKARPTLRRPKACISLACCCLQQAATRCCTLA